LESDAQLWPAFAYKRTYAHSKLFGCIISKDLAFQFPPGSRRGAGLHHRS
jgi:hypothetical protein